MAGIPETLAANSDSLVELRALVGRLSDTDLARPLGGGWTAATALGHLAVWDMRAATMADRWKRDNRVSGANIDDEGVNEAIEPLLLVTPGRALATIALAAAAAANTAIGRRPQTCLCRGWPIKPSSTPRATSTAASTSSRSSRPSPALSPRHTPSRAFC